MGTVKLMSFSSSAVHEQPQHVVVLMRFVIFQIMYPRVDKIVTIMEHNNKIVLISIVV